MFPLILIKAQESNSHLSFNTGGGVATQLLTRPGEWQHGETPRRPPNVGSFPKVYQKVKNKISQRRSKIKLKTKDSCRKGQMHEGCEKGSASGVRGRFKKNAY